MSISVSESKIYLCSTVKYMLAVCVIQVGEKCGCFACTAITPFKKTKSEQNMVSYVVSLQKWKIKNKIIMSKCSEEY